MLQRTEQGKQDFVQRQRPQDAAAAPRRLDLVDIYAFVKSNWRIIAGWTIAAVTVALVYAFTATPLYTATAELALDSRKVQLSKTRPGGGRQLARIHRRLKARSRFYVRRASRSRSSKISSSPTIRNSSIPSRALRSPSSAAFRPVPMRTSAHASRSAPFGGNLGVRRLGLTYVLEISFRSPDREKAARIANAVAQAYVTEQLNVKYEAARRASSWLQERIAELRNQSSNAARAVEDYKEKNNIVDTGAAGAC